jgi:SMC interacting uncharacterized protein involved in chromosome segregation
MGASNNLQVDHIVKQKKKKDLPNTKVYGSINGIVEMHDIANYEILGKKKLGELIQELLDENVKLNGRIDTAKSVIVTLNDRIEKLEKRLNDYGI